MKAPTLSRRGLVAGLAAAPLAVLPASGAVSSDLAALIAACDETDAALYEADEEFIPSKDDCDQASIARSKVAGFPSRSMADILAKAACIGRVWGLDSLKQEAGEYAEGQRCCLDGMAVCLVAELATMAEGGR